MILFLVFEKCILPLECGRLLMNVCLSPMFVSDLKYMLLNSYLDPVIYLIIYWIVGYTYIYICLSCLNLLKDVFQSSGLWFLENLTIPDFSTKEVWQYLILVLVLSFYYLRCNNRYN